MSKKAGKKAKVKVPEIDPNSPEWLEEVARKQREAYEMVQRAMTRSQIEVVLATRDALLKQREELETKAKQQSQDQSDIYQYLRKKLKDNYVAIAELETKVSQAHDARLLREKQLLATIRDLNEERESEKLRLEESLGKLNIELTAIKEYKENSDIYEQTLRDMEATIKSCKDGFAEEVALLNLQLEEEWETGRRDKEERRKITKKAAAKATQEQLGPKTKHRIEQNKKMMAELRFQCCEVEKMHRARQGLLSSNTLLLAQAASARHRVEELARRSHLLQRIIRNMHHKLQARQTSRSDLGVGDDSGGGDIDDGGAKRYEQKLRSAGVGARQVGTGDGTGAEGQSGEGGTLYKLGGMTEEQRQQMLDLREELRREEVGIAAAQTLVGQMSETLISADAERSRALDLKIDLARVLALCHEDPLLGRDGGGSGGNPPTGGFDHPYLNGMHGSESPSAAVNLKQADNASKPRAPVPCSPEPDPPAATRVGASGDHAGCIEGDQERAAADEASYQQGSDLAATNASSSALLPAISAERSSQQQESQEGGQEHQRGGGEGHHLLPPPSRQLRCNDEAGSEACNDALAAASGGGKSKEDIPGAVDGCRQESVAVGGELELWPESAALPSAPPADAPSGPEDGSDGDGRRHGGSSSRCMDTDTLRAVARLFLSKLQISVEVVTPRPDPSKTQTVAFPALPSATSTDGVEGSAFGFNFRNGSRKVLSSRGGSRQKEGVRRVKRKGANGTVSAGRRLDNRSRRSHSRAGVGGGSLPSDDRGIVGGPIGGGQSRAHSRSRRSGPDDATSWSDWHTTGIPSWDILEPAVRQTKRRRTRDTACQTLTYRELREIASTTPCRHGHAMRQKSGIANPILPERVIPQPHSSQRNHLPHQQARHHGALSSRPVSMFSPPCSPLSSASPASPASVYRTTDEGGIVHGAVVRGSRAGKRKQQPMAQRQARVPEWGGHDGDGGDDAAGSTRTEEAFPSQAAHVEGQAGSNGAAATRHYRRSTGFHPNVPPETGGYGMPSDGRRTPLGCQPPVSHVRGRHRQARAGKEQESASSGAGSIRRPETVNNQRMPTSLGKVSVLWGQEPEANKTEAEKGATQANACATPAVMVQSHAGEGRGPRALSQGDPGGSLNAGNEDLDSLTRAHGGFGYEPLSKGPDYRKVLLFTVNDADCRIVRRPQPTDELIRSVVHPHGTVVTGAPSKGGVSGSIPRIDSKTHGTSRSSASRQRGHSVPAGANFVRSAAPLSSGTGRSKDGKAAGRLAPSKHPLDRKDGFAANSKDVERAKIKGSGDAVTSAGVQATISHDRDWEEGGLDSGPTLCSSVSTLSGDAF